MFSVVTDELVEFENTWLKFKTSGEVPIILENLMECSSSLVKKKNQKMSTCKPMVWTWKH